MAIVQLNGKQQRKLRIFIISALISVCAWFLFALSNKYLYRVPAPVQYINVPDNKAFHSLQSDTVTLQVEGSGWQILFSKLRFKPQVISADLSRLENRNWIKFSSQLGFINRQIGGNQRIVSVSPDTLYFDFSKQTVKKVPVKLNKDIRFKKQYDIVDSIQIRPAYVTVTGPLEDLVLIEQWETDQLVKKDVEHDIVNRVPLKKKEKANINVYPTMVEVRIPVGEVTEKVVEIPVKVENGKGNTSVKVLPGKVKVTIIVALKNFTSVTRESFEAVINLDSWEQYHVNSLPVIITKSPEFCKIIKVEPENVDFILRK